MSNTQVVRDFYGHILGTITTDNVGNKVVRDFYGKIVGKYDKKHDVTRDFYGRIVAKGDHASGLIPLRTK